MAAGAADIAEQLAHDLASVAPPDPVIAHRDHQVASSLPDTTTHSTPSNCRQNSAICTIRSSRSTRSEMQQREAVADLEPAHRPRQHAGEACRQFGPVDLAQQVVIGQRVEMGEGLNVVVGHPPREHHRVAANP